MAKPKMPATGDPVADQLLVDDPVALLTGMLLDQHMRQRRQAEHVARRATLPA
jgi:hypothetical protein